MVSDQKTVSAGIMICGLPVRQGTRGSRIIDLDLATI